MNTRKNLEYQYFNKAKEELRFVEKEQELFFEDTFFQGEEREGFYIEPMMKSAWAAQLEVLTQIEKICLQHHITYFADWGTLLGTVRHKGFIPWDDDIDICMLRPDYERFIEIVRNSEDLVCFNIYDNPDWGAHATKVANHTDFTVDRNIIKKYYGFPFIAGIDIFPIDYVPRDKALEEEQVQVLRQITDIRNIRMEMLDYSPTSSEFQQGIMMQKEMLTQIQKTCHITFSKEYPSEQELMILYQEVSALYGEEDANYVAAMHRLVVGQDYYIPKEAYEKSMRLPFENFMMPVPVDYDRVLCLKYGEDYMTPYQRQSKHDYPFYNTLISALSEGRGEEMEETRNYVKRVSIQYFEHFMHKKPIPTVSYSKDFFSEEMINHISVPEERKRIWAAQNEVYMEVKRICQKYQLQVMAIGDSIKEASFYHNYGPESEDIHLAMHRKDYVTFMNRIQEELDPWFNVLTVYASKDHEDMRTYIVTDPYMNLEEEYLTRFHGCPHVVGVDISVIDAVDPDKTQDDVRLQIVEGLLKTARNVGAKPPYLPEELAIVEQWQQVTQLQINLEENLRKEFVLAADRVAGGYRLSSDKVRISSLLQEGINHIYPKTIFEDTIELPFGEITLSVPKGYKELI